MKFILLIFWLIHQGLLNNEYQCDIKERMVGLSITSAAVVYLDYLLFFLLFCCTVEWNCLILSHSGALNHSLTSLTSLLAIWLIEQKQMAIFRNLWHTSFSDNFIHLCVGSFHEAVGKKRNCGESLRKWVACSHTLVSVRCYVLFHQFISAREFLFLPFGIRI